MEQPFKETITVQMDQREAELPVQELFLHQNEFTNSLDDYKQLLTEIQNMMTGQSKVVD